MNHQPKTMNTSLDALGAESQQRLAGILDDYLARLERGDSPDVEELVERHPDLAEPLRLFMTSVDFLHDAAADLRTKRQSRPSEGGSAERRLGDYCLVREIGRGGMGVVYEATQMSLGRRVALKVLPFAAVLDQRQIARFKNEAQAAAHLQHPNIVPVYSVGCDRGVHYYAMQYVEGQSLDGAIRQLRSQFTTVPRATPDGGAVAADDKADTRGPEAPTWESFSGKASPGSRDYYRAAARIGVEAAEALEHAHQCGVIHRDIKPSNLLLDSQGKVWITDFGLARFQTDSSLTVTGDVLGTLRYMSPEQAAGKAALVDQRTDVYSLGVTLYELCTLANVFEETDRQSLLRQVVEQDPRAPRHVDPNVPVDLETILLTAMAKSPADRYATAGDLAGDLKHFLDGKPITARRSSLADRAGKWARRHRAVVAGAMALGAVLLVGSVVSTLLVAAEHAKTKAALAQAEENFQQAEKNLQRAETHFRQLREVVDRFGAHHAQQLKDLPGAEELRRELLIDTLRYYQGFVQHAGDDPALRDELAVTYSKAAAVTEQMGQTQRALDGYRKAARAFEDLSAAHPEQPKHKANLALCQNNMGLLLAAMGKPDEADQAYRRAIAIQSALADQRDDSAQFRSDLAMTYGNLGLLAAEKGRAAEAEDAYRSAMAIQKKLADDHPDQPDHRHHLAITYNNLSFLHAKIDPARALEASRQSLVIQTKLVETHPARLDYASDLALNHNNLGALESHLEKTSEAKASYEQAIAVQERLVRKSPSVVRYRNDLAVSYSNLGRVESKSGDLEGAQRAFERALAIMEDLVQDDPGQLAYRSSLGGIRNNLGMVLEQQGRLDAAAAAYKKAIEDQRFAHEHAPQVTQFREFLDRHYDNYRRVIRARDH